MLRNSCALLLCCLLPLAAQNKRAAEEPTTLLVHGEATVSVEPDIADLDVGVISQAQTSQAAAEQNAAKSKQFVAQLQRLIPPTAINSVNISINPNYRYPKDGAAVVTGYTASNTIRIVVSDLLQLRSVIETATQAGASSINRLTFDLKDEKAARARALSQIKGPLLRAPSRFTPASTSSTPLFPDVCSSQCFPTHLHPTAPPPPSLAPYHSC